MTDKTLTSTEDDGYHALSRGDDAVPDDGALENLDAIDLLDSLPAMIALWDTDQRNLFANQAYLEWFGIAPDEMFGMDIKELLGPKVYPLNLPYIVGALAGERQLFERVLVDASGLTRHVQASYTPHVVNGVVEGFFVLVVDISARVAAEKALLESTEKVVLLHERERIATRLNELVIRQLTEAVLALSAALQPDTPDLPARLGTAIETIDNAISDLRSAIFTLKAGRGTHADAAHEFPDRNEH